MAEPIENPLPATTNPDAPKPATRRRGPDLPLLLAALVSLAVAVLALVGWMPAPPSFDPRWLLAGVVILIGLVLLATSARPRGRR